MYSKNDEMNVFKESLRYMIRAREYAHALHMTDHGPLHAQRVYAICRWLGAIFSLTEYESALLQASALLHDIGMASLDRENHNKESEKLVLSGAKEGLLPFSTEEADLVGKLCLWHRGSDYKDDCVEQCEAHDVRVGLLASILRLSDELDLDYRRTEFGSLEEMGITEKFKKDQLKYHESVLSILGVRIRADKLSKCFELLVDDIAGAKLQIERLVKEILGTPLPFPVKILPTKKSYLTTQYTHASPRKALICAYCNPHGLLTAVLSKISLKLTGIDADIVCSKKETGSAWHFWKNIEGINLSSYEVACFIDLHIDSELIEKVETKLSNNPDCKIFISGATITSGEHVSRLIEKGATLFLGDEHVLFHAEFLSESMSFWIRVAGACNIDNHSIQRKMSKEIYEVTNGLKCSVLDFYNDGSSMILESIINNIEGDNRAFFISKSMDFSNKIQDLDVVQMNFGRVMLLKMNDNIPGRFIYEWIVDCIMKNKCLPYEDFEFKTPYAIYPVYSSDKTSMRVLFLSYFKNINSTLPIKCFCKQEKNPIGTDNTIWKSYNDKKEAEADICSVIASINSEYGDDFTDVSTISANIAEYLK